MPGRGRTLARSLGTALLAATGARGITVLATVALARLLTPTDFGIASTGLLVATLLMPITDIGIAQALLRSPEVDLARRARTAFWLVTLLGFALYGVVLLSASALAAFFRTGTIAEMLRVICIAVPVYAASRIPSALLERKLRFGYRGLPEVAASITYAGVAVALALVKQGYWAIVYATVARSIVLSFLTFVVSDWRPGFSFEASVAQELITYARYLMAGALLRLAYTNVDNAFVGRVLGINALGFYSMAYNLGNLPATYISEPLGRVLVPTYTRLAADGERLRATAYTMVRAVSLVISPVTVVGIVACPSLVPMVLGSKWAPSVVAIQVLLVYGWARTLAPVHWALMIAADLKGASLRINFVTLLIAILLAYPAAREYGYVGIAVLFTILELMRLGWMAVVNWRQLQTSLRVQAAALAWGVLASIAAALGFLAAGLLLGQGGSIATIVGLVFAAAVYAASLRITGELFQIKFDQLRTLFVPQTDGP
jgi:O-antigen/teichoic acid export membrane protein